MRVPLFAVLLAASSLILAAAWGAQLLCITLSGTASHATATNAVFSALLVLWLRWAMCGFIDGDLLFFKAASQSSAVDDAILQTQTTTAKLPVFKLDLDLPPEKRWLSIMRPFVERNEAAKMKALIVSQLVILFGKTGGIVLSLFMKVLLTAHARFCMPAYFRRELLGIAELTTPHGLSYFDLLMLNYGGDFAANCTSGVVKAQWKGARDAPLHLRNMDWFPQEDFRHLCCQIDMHQGGRLLCSSTSWLFLVGSCVHASIPR
jgi:hypothetical protein